jgi:ABC-type transport system involved in multi-copper enzyme maturation permease subunit
MPVFLRWLLRLGPANPIAVRLVHNGSRRSKHLYIRAAYLAILIVVLLWSLLLANESGSLDYRKLAAAGAQSFAYIANLQILLICILAPVFMGGAIAQEASPRTWEVLLTTPLTASEIVLGNLFGRLFFVLALLFASLPLFALTQYFGGVPGSAIFASYFVAAGAALVVGAIAIALAVSRLAGKRAFFVFYVCVVSYLAVTLAADFSLRSAGYGASGGSGVTWMTALNPFLALHALLNPTTYPRAPEGSLAGVARWFFEKPVTTWCVGSVMLSLMFMIASTFTVRAGGLQTFGKSDGVSWWQRMTGRKGADGETHRAPRTVWSNPIAWREAASRNSSTGKIVARWVFLALGLLWGLGLVLALHGGSISQESFRFGVSATVWVELAVIALVAVNTSATAISKEREDGTLDLLLTTPVTASAYLWGKLRGLVTYLLPLLAVPLGTLAIAGAYVIIGGLGHWPEVAVTISPGSTDTSPLVLPEVALTAPIAIIPFMAFAVIVGLHWSLKSQGTLSSVVGTVGVVGAIAGIIGLCAWNIGTGIPVVGPALSAMSPAAFVNVNVRPETLVSRQPTNPVADLAVLRISMAIGAIAAAAAFAALCYGMHANMVRTFDMTVRKLAGQR